MGKYRLMIALKWWIVGKCYIFLSVHILISHDYVTFITKLNNKDICDFHSKSIYIMGDKITVWLIIVIQSLKDKIMMEINTDWKM